MKSTRGFTLLELLIGLTLLGFLLALLFGGFRLASRSWDAVEARLERTMQEQLARALARRLVTQLQPVRWKKAQNQAIAFVGQQERLVAIAPVGGALGEGLQVIEFAADSLGISGEPSMRLVFRHIALDRNAENFSADLTHAKQHVLLDKLISISFDYFGAEKKDAPLQWQEIWTNTEELPRLVRMKLESADAGWTELIVAPMLNGSGCRWDPFYKRCR